MNELLLSYNFFIFVFFLLKSSEKMFNLIDSYTEVNSSVISFWQAVFYSTQNYFQKICFHILYT